MENIGYIGLSRHNVLWRQLEGVANNMANANTPAFKADRLVFSQFLVPSTGPGPSGRTISFVQDRAIFTDFTPGPLRSTGNPLDLAIDGDGFFVIDTPDGQRYSRDGHFRLDEGGMVVTRDGAPVLSEDDLPIFVAPNETDIKVFRDGTVATENGEIGKLRVVDFDNPQELEKVGLNLYTTDAAPQPAEAVNLVQGMIEDSNVNPVVEITRMMGLLRNYQGVQKFMDDDNQTKLKAYETLSQARRA